MSEEEKITTELLLQDLSMELKTDHEESFNHIRNLLIEKLDQLIRNPEKLFLLLYRIDVNEQKAKAALEEKDPATALADLIIHRQIQKARTRIEFGKRDASDDYNVGE